MLIEKSNLKKDFLKNTSVLITGGGGGIGYETSRALAWLGADVIIAEIDRQKGLFAQNTINKELGTDKVFFYKTDIGDEKEINKLTSMIKKRYGTLDVVVNNATITPLGAITSVPARDWDKSYFVNLRAPVLLVQKFLPEMIKRNKGVIVFVPSSGAAPYMGAYEVFKTAQVELCNTLAGEIENTDIITYSIGPGLVKTDTAKKGIETIARLMNISTDEFYKMNEKQMIDAEEAGTGFAVSIALAKQYNGLEIGSMQALLDGGIFAKTSNEDKNINHNLDEEQKDKLKLLIGNVINNYTEQYNGWLMRNVFERQWVLRDFKKTVGMSVDEMKNELLQISNETEQKTFPLILSKKEIFLSLKKYYERQYKLLQGYEKNPEKLKENSLIVNLWIEELEKILKLI